MGKIFTGQFEFILSAFFTLLISVLDAGEFPLRVNDISGFDGPWPIVAGLPFPVGEIRDADSIRIMSGKGEVPCQIDITATWRDGSIRWALAGFTASPQGEYRVEYGGDAKRTVYPKPLVVKRQADGGFSVDTGAAIYRFDRDKLLPENGWLVSGEEKIQIFSGSGAGSYLVDNAGRTARIVGKTAEVQNEVLREGPGRLVLRRSGWYVTDTGEKAARAEVWFYFSAGTPCFKITHSLVITEDTNRVWFRDYGLEFSSPAGPLEAYFAVGEPGGDEEVRKISDGDETYMLQGEYPHFAGREYRAAIGKSEGGKDTVAEEIEIAGDWGHGDYGNWGITIVMPWLAERFPKEISFGHRGARAVIWSGRSGKELDFRTETLIDEYWQKWALAGTLTSRTLAETPSNARGTCRTHDIWILPRWGKYYETEVRKTAHAAARCVLALADPKWLCATGAMGCPMLEKDTGMFPLEEQVLSDCWERVLIPLRTFPMNGFISWGCFPDMYYSSPGGVIMSNSHLLSALNDCGLRQVPFRMYARSGERKYHEWGCRFGGFTGDYGIAHWEVPGKEKGSFIIGGLNDLPLFWQGDTQAYAIIDGEIRHWLNDYLLNGDERSLQLLEMVRDYCLKHGKPQFNLVSAARILLTLSLLDRNEELLKMSQDYMYKFIDLESQNGISGNNPLYKDERNTYIFLEYYLETGDEFVKKALLKLLDHRYRFDRRGNPVSHRNYDGLTYAEAYRMTGDGRYLRVAEQTVRDAVYYSIRHPLSADLSELPGDFLQWKTLPHGIWLPQNEYHSFFIGIPAALKLISEKGWSGKRTPVVIKSLDTTQAKVLFSHRQGRDTEISFYFTSARSGVNLQVFGYPDLPGKEAVKGIKTELEKRMQWPASLVKQPDDIYHAHIKMPSETPGGLYLLSTGGNESFTVLDITGDKAALYCPDGFWAPSGSFILRKSEGSFGRAGEGMPLFFRVPPGLDALKILVTRPAVLKRPDGSVAMEISDADVGTIKIPVKGKGGIWSLEPYVRNFLGVTPPAFFKLLNVEPVVAVGLPDFLPDGINEGLPSVPAQLPKPASVKQFAPGVEGSCLRLSGNKTVRFNSGAGIASGGYTYFPGMTGTAEFWFRADSSTHEMPILLFQSIDFPFISGPSMQLRHRYWIRGGRDIYSMIQDELLHEESKTYPVGFQARHFFNAGEWVHIAYTWDVRTGENGTQSDMAIFLNGRKLTYGEASYGLKMADGRRKLYIDKDGNYVVLGPFNGSMDILRLSDVIRYTNNFTPSVKVPPMDKNTRALFLFDDNLEGITAFSPENAKAE